MKMKMIGLSRTRSNN